MSSLATYGRTCGNGFELQQSRFRINLKESFPTVTSVGQWNKLPGGARESPPLQVFKKRHDRHVWDVQEQQVLLLCRVEETLRLVWFQAFDSETVFTLEQLHSVTSGGLLQLHAGGKSEFGSTLAKWH